MERKATNNWENKLGEIQVEILGGGESEKKKKKAAVLTSCAISILQ